MFFKRLTEKKLGELLVENGHMSRSQLDDALKLWEARKGASLSGEVFVELGLATEEDILLALIKQYHFPHIPLEKCNPDKALLKLIAKEVAVKYKLFPVDKVGNNLTIAIANPLNAEALKKVGELSQCEVTAFISTPSAIRSAIVKYYEAEPGDAFPEFFVYK